MEFEVDNIVFSSTIRHLPILERTIDYKVFSRAMSILSLENYRQLFAGDIYMPEMMMISAIRNKMSINKIKVVYEYLKHEGLDHVFIYNNWEKCFIWGKGEIFARGRWQNRRFYLPMEMSFSEISRAYKFLEYENRFYFEDLDSERFDEIKIKNKRNV